MKLNINPKNRWRTDAIIRTRRLAAARAHLTANMLLLEQTRMLRDVIDPDVLFQEPAVADTRWTQYGYANAFEATEEFTRAYVRHYDYTRGKYFDRTEKHKCPVAPDFAANRPEVMSALYQARQYADTLGIPYAPFIANMFQRLRGPGLYQRIPLPNQLFPPSKPRKRRDRKQYTTKSGVAVEHKTLRHGLVVQDYVLSGRYSVLDPDWDARFFARNYLGDPAQDRALRALATHKHVFGTSSALRNALERGGISVDNAHRFFPQPVVESALRSASALPVVEAPDADLEPYRPHCLGLIQPNAPAPECADCPWIGKCRTLATHAERKQVELTGYANRAERDRVNARDRQRDSRRSRKEAKAAEVGDHAEKGQVADVTSPNNRDAAGEAVLHRTDDG